MVFDASKGASGVKDISEDEMCLGSISMEPKRSGVST
jgi:hypothetical protein